MGLWNNADKIKAREIYKTFTDAYESEDWVTYTQQIKIIRSKYIPEFGKLSSTADHIYAIDSEVDCYPTGPERQHWNKQALQKLDAELYEIFKDSFHQLWEQRAELKKIIGL
ncbi:hypothetical protein [Kordiimonas laminariae]|uniref:hypothetical protein n=1 Tax=Kordiimonas laminariae TaxID=2917717 RepID=UPI001FF1503F|nr:hypothetical protein [Kordiimonas laminariae]MCK0070809.1 hypothetical protein [Kordiimonas laminariae]